MLWRLIVTISSSRNFSFYLIFSFVVIALAIKHIALIRHNIYILITVLLVVLCFNCFKLKGSFRNTYLSDIKENLCSFLHDEHYILFIESKDFRRIFNSSFSPEKQLSFKDTSLLYHNLLALYTKYNFQDNDAYFVLAEKKNKYLDDQIIFFFKENNIRFRKIQQYYTNTKKTKFYSVYSLERFKPPVAIDKRKAISHEQHLKGVLQTSNYKNSSDILNVIEKGTIKIYNPLLDVYIIQYQKRLYWFIGSSVSNDTEVIYQLYTEYPDLLPSRRIEYGFDNLGFRIGGGTELKKLGNYRIFTKSLPESYPINYISVGFNTAGIVTWFNLFQPDPIK